MIKEPKIIKKSDCDFMKEHERTVTVHIFYEQSKPGCPQLWCGYLQMIVHLN